MSRANYAEASIYNFVSVKAAPDAFAGGTANARGDHDGATSGVTTIFTVTGDVLVRVFGVCTTDLTGASATLELGVADDPDLLIAQTTATGIDANDIWCDASPTYCDTLASVTGPYVIVNGQDIVETTATASITAGQIYYVCLWRPLSPDGKVVAA